MVVTITREVISQSAFASEKSSYTTGCPKRNDPTLQGVQRTYNNFKSAALQQTKVLFVDGCESAWSIFLGDVARRSTTSPVVV